METKITINIPEELRDDFKKKCVDDKTTMTDKIHESIKEYISKKPKEWVIEKPFGKIYVNVNDFNDRLDGEWRTEFKLTLGNELDIISDSDLIRKKGTPCLYLDEYSRIAKILHQKLGGTGSIYVSIPEDIFASMEKEHEINMSTTTKEDKYASLKEELPEINIKTDNNDELAQKLIKEAGVIEYYNGPESDGLNLAVSSKKGKLLQEAQKHCKHELQTGYNEGYTNDARKELTRTITCKKCGLHKTDVVRESVDNEKILSS
jgi:hypothetical protein